MGRSAPGFATSPTARRSPASSEYGQRELRQRRNGGEWLRLIVCEQHRRRRGRGMERASPSASRSRSPAPRSTSPAASRSTPSTGPRSPVETIRFLPATASTSRPTSPRGRASRSSGSRRELRELLGTIQHPSSLPSWTASSGRTPPISASLPRGAGGQVLPPGLSARLLDHTVSVAQAVSASASAFPGIDRDVAITGALLHDIGKTDGLQRRSARHRPDRCRAPPGRDPPRLLPGPPPGRADPRASTRIWPRPSSTSSSPITARWRMGRPFSPRPARRPWSTRSTTWAASSGSFDRIERGLADGEAWSRFDRAFDSAAYFSSRAA